MSNKTVEKMGLPRVSGKRRWSETDADEETLSCKVLCTSPPHAICAEDILQSTPTSNASMKMFTTTQESSLIPDSNDVSLDRLSDCSEDDAERFIDDEEDKDSGFIDGNSIDNSSDDEIDSKGLTCEPSKSDNAAAFTPLKEDSICHMDVEESQMNPVVPCVSSQSISILSTNADIQSTVSLATSRNCERHEEAENEITTVTSALSGTVISSYNQGIVSQSYESQQFSSYQNNSFGRPASPAWSCTFYDGSTNAQPNKYMEISPSRISPNQPIKCDENGKSYIQLGSAAPYINTYSNECANLNTTPSAFQNTTFTASQSFGQPTSSYYSSNNSNSVGLQNFPSNGFTYPQTETSTTNYDSDNSCTYSYAGCHYSTGRGNLMGRPVQRCTSPYCDPTKTRPRSPCYQQQRISVFNMSMFKLNRFSRFPEPSLHKSVLICNTLKHIERELANEGINMPCVSHSQNYGIPSQPSTPAPSPIPENVSSLDSPPSTPTSSPLNEGPLPSIHSPLMGSQMAGASPFSPSMHGSPPTPPPHSIPYSTSCQSSFYPVEPLVESKDSSILRPYNIHSEESASSSATEASADSDPVWSMRTSCLPDEKNEGINWCSVLLSSQSDLDSVNNNECNAWSDDTPHLTPASSPSSTAHSPLAQRLSKQQPSIEDGIPENLRRTDNAHELDSLLEDMLNS